MSGVSMAKHEHYWTSGGTRFRLVWFRRWWVVEEFVRANGIWNQHDILSGVTDELARLAGLVPPEDRDE